MRLLHSLALLLLLPGPAVPIPVLFDVDRLQNLIFSSYLAGMDHFHQFQENWVEGDIRELEEEESRVLATMQRYGDQLTHLHQVMHENPRMIWSPTNAQGEFQPPISTSDVLNALWKYKTIEHQLERFEVTPHDPDSYSLLKTLAKHVFSQLQRLQTLNAQTKEALALRDELLSRDNPQAVHLATLAALKLLYE